MRWWYDDASPDYALQLQQLGIDIQSDFSRFYLHAEDGSTFIQRGEELYHIGWFAKNTNYGLAVQSTCEMLRLSSDEYLPLSSFEGESGYFYNKSTGEVISLSLGSDMVDFLEGRKKPEWKSFSDFLEHFFELSTNE
ncbi:hypothetical protein ACQJ22_11380 [Pseudomonas fragariae (ex Marin et al. 2024)]|uniref:hypothetical protein n=1 Tax=Pseudomonas TaxID=286 RepID=UPI0004B73A9F|nr:hypothetical protein [Pseudomonas syringae]